MKKIAIINTSKVANYINAYKSIGIDLITIDKRVNPNDFDALIVPGGVDVNPKLYNEENFGSIGINDELDSLEMDVIDDFVKVNKPILGICRGLQIINVYFGGTLIQDIKQKEIHSPNNKVEKLHSIKTTGNNYLSELYGKEFVVNSWHHQAIKRLADNFDVLAKSDDGIIEAIKHKELPIIAVQFHPERMTLELKKPDEVDGIEVLKYFLTLLV